MHGPNEILVASEEIRSNTHKTIVFFCLMFVCIWTLAFLLGNLLGNPPLGWKIGFLTCLIVIPLELMSARFTIMTLTGCTRLDVSNPAEKRLLNIVEGISISAGLQHVPDVYLIESKIPNAFSAGWNENSSFIGITTGLADMMDDQELEGVIAHEIAHIVHRDIMICQMSLALNTAILVLSLFIHVISLLCAINTRDNIAKIAFTILALIIYPISALISFLLCMTISRKREFSADALAVRLCSYNEGLARALEKLERDCPSYGKEQQEKLGGKSTECLYFYFPTDNLFSTHPSTQKRIQRLRSMV